MRLGGQEKAGYYPTPLSLIPFILQWLKFLPADADGDLKHKILDPCAGEGAALHMIATAAGRAAIPFGIELDEGRAEQLAVKLFGSGHFLTGDAFDMLVEPESMDSLFLNPPYDNAKEVDHSLRRQRLEYLFLKTFTHALKPQGILVWIIPQSLLRNQAAVRFLAANYGNFHIMRFDNDNDIFKQVVVIGVKSENPEPATEIADRVQELGAIEWERIADITIESPEPEKYPLYVVPFERIEQGYRTAFRPVALSPAETMEKAAPIRDDHIGAAFKVLSRQDIRTATPPRAGHMTMLIPAGAVDGAVLQLKDEEGEDVPALIKGRQVRTTVTTTEYDEIEIESEYSDAIEVREVTRTKKRDVIVSEVKLLDALGNTHTVEPNQMEAFLEAHMHTLAETLIQRTNPYYRFESLNGFEKVIKSLNRKRKIPNTDKTGLMVAQQHATAAAATVLQSEPTAYVVGEMGTGKTLIGTGVAACLNAHGQFKRGIVLCPPHLVNKWQNEIKLTWEKCATMVLRTVSDVERFYQHPGPILAVTKSTTVSLGPGWEHIIDRMGPTGLKQRTQREGYKWERRTYDWLDDEKADHLIDRYKRGNFGNHRPLTRIYNQERMTRNTRLRKPGKVIVKTKRAGMEKITANQAGPYMSYKYRRGVRCPTCGYKLNLAVKDFTTKKRFCDNCRSALFTYTTERRRWPLAEIIKRAAHRYGSVDLVITDEVHQYKGGGSDRGAALGQIAGSARRNLALTGTLFGGKASTIFWLLYRTIPAFREAYTNHAAEGSARILETKFVEEYGLYEQTETTVEKDGMTSGNALPTYVTKEIPGLVPKLINWILPYAVFINLKDLGYALPPYTERNVTLTLPSKVQEEYNRIAGLLFKAVSQALARNDKGLLAIYMRLMLSWPEYPSRRRVAQDRYGETIVVTETFPVEAMMPKETEVIRHIKRSLEENRRVMLYIQMTATTDITARWVDLIKREGISVSVCRASSDDREEWFDKERDKGTQVIITHPRRVELGMDLYAWPEVIWLHDMDHSSYTIAQASRRAWRIGQTEPVNVTFYDYEETMQVESLFKTMLKVAAHLRLNGGLISDDAIVHDDTDGMTTALMKSFLQQTEVQQELSHARSYLTALENGDMPTTAASFPQLAGMADEEIAEQLEVIIFELEARLAEMKPAVTLDALFATQTEEANQIRSVKAHNYILDDEGEEGYHKYVETVEDTTAAEEEPEELAGELFGFVAKQLQQGNNMRTLTATRFVSEVESDDPLDRPNRYPHYTYCFEGEDASNFLDALEEADTAELEAPATWLDISERGYDEDGILHVDWQGAEEDLQLLHKFLNVQGYRLITVDATEDVLDHYVLGDDLINPSLGIDPQSDDKKLIIATQLHELREYEGKTFDWYTLHFYDEDARTLLIALEGANNDEDIGDTAIGAHIITSIDEEGKLRLNWQGNKYDKDDLNDLLAELGYQLETQDAADRDKVIAAPLALQQQGQPGNSPFIGSGRSALLPKKEPQNVIMLEWVEPGTHWIKAEAQTVDFPTLYDLFFTSPLAEEGDVTVTDAGIQFSEDYRMRVIGFLENNHYTVQYVNPLQLVIEHDAVAQRYWLLRDDNKASYDGAVAVLNESVYKNTISHAINAKGERLGRASFNDLFKSRIVKLLVDKGFTIQFKATNGVVTEQLLPEPEVAEPEAKPAANRVANIETGSHDTLWIMSSNNPASYAGIIAAILMTSYSDVIKLAADHLHYGAAFTDQINETLKEAGFTVHYTDGTKQPAAEPTVEDEITKMLEEDGLTVSKPTVNDGSPPQPNAAEATDPNSIVEEAKIYSTFRDHFNMLAERAITPERLARMHKAGKPLSKIKTVTVGDSDEILPRGEYLSVFEDGKLWLYQLTATKPKPVQRTATEFVDYPVYLPERLNSNQFISANRWEVVIK